MYFFSPRKYIYNCDVDVPKVLKINFGTLKYQCLFEHPAILESGNAALHEVEAPQTVQGKNFAWEKRFLFVPSARFMAETPSQRID